MRSIFFHWGWKNTLWSHLLKSLCSVEKSGIFDATLLLHIRYFLMGTGYILRSYIVCFLKKLGCMGRARKRPGNTTRGSLRARRAVRASPTRPGPASQSCSVHSWCHSFRIIFTNCLVRMRTKSSSSSLAIWPVRRNVKLSLGVYCNFRDVPYILFMVSLYSPSRNNVA